jgi:High potential iron-sulfur protein
LPVENQEADMSATSGVPSRAFSRRIVLLHSAGCAAGAAALLLPLKQAAAKMSQASVAYQDSPKGDQKCSTCSLFQEPNACTLVDGNISSEGWCKFWVKKAG